MGAKQTNNQKLIESNNTLRGAIRLAVSTLRRLGRNEEVDIAPVVAILKRERQDAQALIDSMAKKKGPVFPQIP
jgi:hypothetical protein